MNAKNQYLITLSCIILSWFIIDIITPQSFPHDLEISTADVIYTSSQAAVESTSSWQSQRLPDDWLKNNREPEQYAWYRFSITLEEPPNQTWGIFFPHINMNMRVYLNEKLVGDGGSFKPRLANNWNRPVYLPIPADLFNVGKNTFLVQIATDQSGRGFLGKIYLGPDSTLKPAYDAYYFTKVELIKFITIIMVGAGIFVAALWFYRKTEVTNGLFTLLVFIWAIHNLNLFIANIPVDRVFWDWLWKASLCWLMIIMVLFVHRILDKTRQKYETLLLYYGGLSSIAMLAIATFQPYWFYFVAYHIWDTLSLIIGIYLLVLIFKAHQKKQDTKISWLLMSASIALSFGLHDWLVINGFLPRTHGYYIQYSAIMIVAVFYWILLMRFIDALKKSDAIQDDQIQKKKHILNEERQRIMRDMHDGVGGQLVTTLAMIQAGETNIKSIEEALKDSLQDLRLTIDSFDPLEKDIPSVLGMLRARIQPQLEKSGLQLNWKITALPSIQISDPHHTLQIMRIVQEVIVNIIKHAHATTITVATGILPNHKPYIEISDDGSGINSSNHYGRGMRNMRYRATNIGAQLEFHSNHHGTTVCLIFEIETTLRS